MDLLAELEARGLRANCTDPAGLADLLAHHAPVSVYAGYDPTSSSLHIGNLVPTILLKRFQLAGHRPIIVVGGATGMIGDPSGKSDERNLLDEATIAANVTGIRDQLAKLLDFDGPNAAVMTNNYDWTKDVTFLCFMRDYGKFLTVNYMTEKDSVKSRLANESGISWTEFSYMLLQAFDFVQLSRSHDCRLQVGGNDQYGNITAGTELARKIGGNQLYGWTAPLMLDSTGQKMGKTSTGERIWLDATRTTPFKFYQYWFNLTDADAARYLPWFSLEPMGIIEDQLRAHAADGSQRIAQRELARAMTAWVHGKDAVAAVESAQSNVFSGDLSKLDDHGLAQLEGSIPVIDVPRGELEAGIPLVDLIVRAKLEGSKGKARTAISQGGAYLNDVAITDVHKNVTVADLLTATRLVLRKGKKSHCIVRAV